MIACPCCQTFFFLGMIGVICAGVVQVDSAIRVETSPANCRYIYDIFAVSFCHADRDDFKADG